MSFRSQKSVYLFLYIAFWVVCVECFSEETIFEDEDIYRTALELKNSNTGITVPGTKWCGPGSATSNFNDLGKHRDTDACCRDHDHCEEVIESGAVSHGIANTDWFAILKCSCEQKFLNCLQAVNSVISNTLGYIYFSARGKCLSLGHPIVRCVRYQESTFRKRCIQYKIDQEKQEIWQLYDMPFYTTNNKGKKT